MSNVEIEKILTRDDEGRYFSPFLLAVDNYNKFVNSGEEILSHADAAAYCLEILAEEIRNKVKKIRKSRAKSL